jgi:ATP-binding cassette subfamily B protein
VLDFVNVPGVLPEMLAFLPSLFRVLEAPPDLPTPARPRLAPRPIRHGIVFERVAFAYPGSPGPVLRDVSFAIRPGERVALVGPAGWGKTAAFWAVLAQELAAEPTPSADCNRFPTPPQPPAGGPASP